MESALAYTSENLIDVHPETIHEKAGQLMRLLVADHPHVDGNKRTTLSAAAYLYELNGYQLSPDDGVRTHLRSFATDSERTGISAVVGYLRDHTTRKP